MARRVEDIEKDITQLSPSELARFRAWYMSFDAAAWDKQIEADIKAGKLDRIAESAITEYKTGKNREL